MQILTERLSSGSSLLPEPTRISIARDFSDTPIGRYRADGNETGEVFREDFLVPALQKGKVDLELDGVYGLPSSFWEEVMGGLVRDHYALGELRELLTLICNEDALKVFVRTGWKFAEEAEEKKNAN